MKKIFYTILITLTFFLGLNSVSADLNRMYMSFDGSVFEIGDSGYLTTNSKQFTNRITYTDESYDKDRNTTLYARYAVCSNSPIYGTYINVQDTNIKCRYSRGIGTLTFLTGSYNENNLETYTITSDGPSTYTYNTSFYINTSSGVGSGYFDLFGVDVGRSLSDFPTYTAESEILDELDSLHNNVIVQFDKLNDTNENILYYVQKMYENMVTCRDSYNLLNPVGSSIVRDGVTFTNNQDGSFTVKGTSTAPISYNLSNLINFPILLKKSNYYTQYLEVLDGTFGGSIVIAVKNDSGVVSYNYFSSNSSYPKSSKYITENFSVYSYTHFIPSGVTIDTTYRVQFQLGDSFTSYEPFGQEICKSKTDETNDAINESNKKLDETNNKLQQQQDFMNDDDTTESSNAASSFFSGFSTDTHGLTGIITAPITLIGNITSSSCSPLQVPLPYVNKNLSLPCMTSIYSQYFGSFYDIYKVITFGIVAYWVCVRIFNLVKDFKNPEHDEIEVMDL